MPAFTRPRWLLTYPASSQPLPAVSRTIPDSALVTRASIRCVLARLLAAMWAASRRLAASARFSREEGRGPWAGVFPCSPDDPPRAINPPCELNPHEANVTHSD